MTCYIHRESEKQLIGPFSSPDKAFKHREKIRDANGKRPGRPGNTGTIVSCEEAIKMCVRHAVRRVTPEQDVTAAKAELKCVA